MMRDPEVLRHEVLPGQHAANSYYSERRKTQFDACLSAVERQSNSD